MRVDVGTTAASGVTRLLGGILSDGEELFKQGLALVRCEIAQDLDSARRAAFMMAAGAGTGVAGLTLLCFALVHFLSAHLPEVAVWVFFGAVGAPVVAAGVLLGYFGARTMRTTGPRANSTEAIEE